MLPLELYNLNKSYINNSDLIGNNYINTIYRLNSSAVIKYNNKVKFNKRSLNENINITLIWADNYIYNLIPSKSDYYIWVICNLIPDPDLVKSFIGKHIFIIQSDILRNKYSLNISKSISWESTTINTLYEYHDGKLFRDKLKYSNLLIILFGYEGALILDPEKDNDSTLWFLQSKMEDDFISEYPGYVPESFELFITLIIEQIGNAIHNNDDVITILKLKMNYFLTGLITTHILGYNEMLKLNQAFYKKIRRSDFQILDSKIKKDYPYIMFQSVKIPCNTYNWEILPNLSIDDYIYFNENKIIFNKIIYDGIVKTSIGCPILKINNFISIGKSEIESISAVKNLIYNYLYNKNQIKPLNITVFGQPGSGKSYCVKEIANSISNNSIPFLEYNLSQYDDSSLSYLIKIFHDIQNYTILNKIPIIFIDEFDTNNYQWLKYFLMPMQDGVFIENGVKRPLGKCIFVFAGGVNHNKDDFDKVIKEDTNKARDNKIPDFKSRIKGYINILNINPNNSVENKNRRDEPFYLIKRSIILSNILIKLKTSQNKNIILSDDVLFAFLYTIEYKNGVRSMEAILESCKITSNGIIGTSNMPPNNQLELHVNSKNFTDLLKFRSYRNKILGLIAISHSKENNENWNYMNSKKQNDYYKMSENTYKTLTKTLKLKINLFENNVNYNYWKKMILLSKHENCNISPISNDELIHFTQILIDELKKTNNETINNEKDIESKYLEIIKFMFKPFDNNPNNNGIFLFRDDY